MPRAAPLVVLLLLAGCAAPAPGEAPQAEDGEGSAPRDVEAPDDGARAPTPRPLAPQTLLAPWSSVRSWAYQLQDVDVDALGAAPYDLYVVDASRDGSDAGAWGLDEVKRMQGGAGAPHLVLAYLSIGEAESYRGYWRAEWDADEDGAPDAGAPAWLADENPEWDGNYKVRYWDPAWQEIVLARVDAIVRQGFDGVYLDIIDAYEHWEAERPTSEQDMVAFVSRISQHARAEVPRFGVFPQNGEALAVEPGYLDAITGIGREDTRFDDDAPQDNATRDEAIAYLDLFANAGKLVLVVDYPTSAAHVDAFHAAATTRGFVPYATTRALDTLQPPRAGVT